MGLSCSADRNILAKIDKNGLWIEDLERDPARLIPEEIRSKFSNTCVGGETATAVSPQSLGKGVSKALAADSAIGMGNHSVVSPVANPQEGVPPRQANVTGPQTASSGTAVGIDLNKPMKDILAELSRHPIGARLSLNGKIVVARDIAHAKFKELLDSGKDLPEYLKKHPVYYAGPAKQPKNKPSGSFGPTTAGRMDSYVAPLQAKGASMVMIAKGNRSRAVTDACKKYGGFYLGSPGGPAALLAERNIKKVETIDYPELGMEAVWAIEVKDFPAFILVDDKGGDFFRK
jgi:tartrate/fumarate subfamily iron-sulfur-dependent hydro-lyase beta chain